MAINRMVLFVGVLFASSLHMALSKGFLEADEQALMSADGSFGKDLQTALEEVMGCGKATATERLAEIEQSLDTMWRTLPKSSTGRIELRSLRYLVHRYFMQQSSLQVRGFEQNEILSSSDKEGLSQTLGKQMPHYIENLLGRTKSQEGFTLQDAASMVATLEQLIFDSESVLIESVYRSLNKDTKRIVNMKEMKNIMETYMVHWMLGDDTESIEVLRQNSSLLDEAFPHWDELKEFVFGRIKSLNFERSHAAVSGYGKNVMAQQYSFDDTHAIVGGMTKSFQTYWESECAEMRSSLVALDKGNTGRVHLADFYRAGMNEEWRFGESEAYLRDMGVLDESAPWHGKQVIIANYLQAASNCIVSTPHYLVCCQNPCEGIMSEIEAEIAEPTAPPETILEVVGNMTWDDEGDELVSLDQALVEQLQRVAESHAGSIPLHGRLFAQWLHYVFPRECPFPHKAGSFSMSTPIEFGDDYIASKDEMRSHAKDVSKLQQRSDTAIEDLRMSQWSEEEELFADYDITLKAPWEGNTKLALVGLSPLVLAALWSVFSGARGNGIISLEASSDKKIHLV